MSAWCLSCRSWLRHQKSRWARKTPVIKEGVRVRQGQVILQLADPKQPRVRVRIPEPAAKRVKPGMPATVRVDAFPDRVLRGTVETVAAVAWPSSRTWSTSQKLEYAVTIRLADPPDDLRIGLTAEVHFDVK